MNVLRLSLIFFLLSSLNVFPQITGSTTDSRDGKEYKTVRIGKQEWMAENMNFENLNSWCYNNKPEMCQKYGRLYSYIGATQACPPGWRLPTMKDWNRLIDHVGEETAALELREGGKTGFDVLMAGVRYDYGVFNHLGENGYFWSHVFADDQPAWVYLFGRTMFTATRIQSFSGNGFSVRCIRR